MCSSTENNAAADAALREARYAMRHVFIINPKAGKKDQTGRIYAMAEALREKHGLSVDCLLTERPGGATEMARKLAESGQPSYMRLIRKDFKTVYENGADFEIGKGALLREGSDVTIIASGILVTEALEAADALAAEGVSARVIDMYTWKPLDEEIIEKAARETGCIVTAENHQIGCGLGSAVANVLARKAPVPQEFIGIQNRFGQVGPQDFLMEEYGLKAQHIVDAARRAVSRK